MKLSALLLLITLTGCACVENHYKIEHTITPKGEALPSVITTECP